MVSSSREASRPGSTRSSRPVSPPPLDTYHPGAPAPDAARQPPGTAIRSCVRVRPLSAAEKAAGQRSVWVVHEGTSLRLLPKELQADGRAVWLADSEYGFDAAFGPEVETAEVHASAAGDIGSTVLAGTSCTLIAFGQTGSGKTYTMTGSWAHAMAGTTGTLAADAAGASPGIIVLAFRDLLTRLEESAASGRVPGKPHRYRLRTSCIEVYNEQCNDLLAPGQRNLRLFEAPGGGAVIQKVAEIAIKSEAQLLECLQVRRARHRCSVGAPH